MLNRDNHDSLVAQLYSSATGEIPWAVTLARVADAFGTSAAAMQVSDAARNTLAVDNHGYSPEFAAAFYASEAYANDPRVPYYRTVKPGTIYFDHNLYDVAEMDRNPWCRQSIDILKVKYQMGMVARLPNDSASYMTVLSTEHEGHASEAAIVAYRRLAPHFEQASALGHVVERRAATHSALLEALALKADGVIMLDRSGAPGFVNDAAGRILAAADGLAFSAGAFVTARAAETRRLQGMIGNAIAVALGPGDRPGGRMLVTRPSGLWPYVAHVMAAPPSAGLLAANEVACVIHLQDLAAERLPSKPSLIAIFGLSEREADLAVELVRCASLAQAAANVSMAVNTARNHLQSIFRKSGAASQAEAVQLFSRLP